MHKSFRLAVCQMDVTQDKEKNVAKASEMLVKAAETEADIAVLPEMFNCPYDTKMFERYAESVTDGPTIKALAEKSKELGIYVFGGSIPEADAGRIFNTCFVFGRDGSILGRHRKMHLFDINVPGKISFKESDVLSAGNDITVIDTEFCKIGTSICYDIRFPELSRLMALNGAEVIILPGAFNMVTGPAHWELLMRTRALDNQVYLAAASPARNSGSSYTAYGNSMIVGPWGDVLQKSDEKEDIIFADIVPSEIERVRRELPLLKHRRIDIYSLEKKC
jgi:omega-amidase